MGNPLMEAGRLWKKSAPKKRGRPVRLVPDVCEGPRDTRKYYDESRRIFGNYIWGHPDDKSKIKGKRNFCCPQIAFKIETLNLKFSLLHVPMWQKREATLARNAKRYDEESIMKMMSREVAANANLDDYPKVGRVTRTGKPDKRYKPWQASSWHSKDMTNPLKYLPVYRSLIEERDRRPDRSPHSHSTILDFKKVVTAKSNIYEFLFDQFIYLIQSMEMYFVFTAETMPVSQYNDTAERSYRARNAAALEHVLRVYEIIKRYIRAESERHKICEDKVIYIKPNFHLKSNANGKRSKA